MASDPLPSTRYEHILRGLSTGSRDLVEAFALASHAARAAVPVRSDHEIAIRDVAAGVAAPTLVGCVLWMLREASRRGLQRLRFLSRDGQILYEIAGRLQLAMTEAADARSRESFGAGLDLEYVYSSRLTWSLAGTDPERLADTPWLFNSFMKSNAADVCARLGLPLEEFRSLLVEVGASLDGDTRADAPAQADALRRFLRMPRVRVAVQERIAALRPLLLDYAAQHQLTDDDTGLVDAGWTGRMIGSLLRVCGPASGSRPHVLLWVTSHAPPVGPTRTGSPLSCTTPPLGRG